VCYVYRCPDLWLQCSVSFVHGLTKTQYTRLLYFFTRSRNSRCTVITGLATQNGAHRKPSTAATPSWKLVARPRCKHEKPNTGSAWETWTVPAADSVRWARVGSEINLLSTTEIAPFFCACSACLLSPNIFHKASQWLCLPGWDMSISCLYQYTTAQDILSTKTRTNIEAANENSCLISETPRRRPCLVLCIRTPTITTIVFIKCFDFTSVLNVTTRYAISAGRSGQTV
jgi:hypothetical protein